MPSAPRRAGSSARSTAYRSPPVAVDGTAKPAVAKRCSPDGTVTVDGAMVIHDESSFPTRPSTIVKAPRTILAAPGYSLTVMGADVPLQTRNLRVKRFPGLT